MRTICCLVLVVTSLFKIDVAYTGKPDGFLWGSPEWIEYDSKAHVWINRNTALELVYRLADRDLGYRKHTLPERVPEGRAVRVKLNRVLWRKSDPVGPIQLAMACAMVPPSRRFKLVNVEQAVNEIAGDTTQFRLWPHLGLLSVGTVAEEEGWDVELYDELVDGPVDLERMVRPGDVVGLSLVVSGMERGVELARQAKRLGASHVIVGNDAAIFRTDQVLRLPDHPIDAVFTSNSLAAVRQFFQRVGSAEITRLNIPGVAAVPTGVNPSNERQVIQAERLMRVQLRQQGNFDPQDVFVVPRLGLFGSAHWQQVWQNYRTVFGHKHAKPAEVCNALALFAQGCTRTGTADVCSYCTIAGVADIRMPTRKYLRDLLETYAAFGINYVFNVTDSSLEMRRVVSDLKSLGAFFSEGLMLYGRAWGLAHHPELIDEWRSLTGGRLLVNVGIDSGDERILSTGVVKASQAGSRLDENRRAVQNLAASGAHLHYSLVFGSPGETRETCERSLEFFEWSCGVLGTQLDQCETDIYWLNHGAPASRVFHDYEYARELAGLAGKELSRNTWEHCFHRHRDTLIVPWECEEAWYDCFTSITIEEAQEYNAHVTRAVSRHEGAAPGRAFWPS